MSLTHLGLHIVGNFHGRSHLTQTHPWSPALGVGTPGVRSHVSLGTGRQQRGPGDGCAGRWAGDVVLCGAQASPTFACRNVFWENCRLAGAFLFSHSFTRQSSHTNTSPVKVPAAAWACPQRRAAARRDVRLLAQPAPEQTPYLQKEPAPQTLTQHPCSRPSSTHPPSLSVPPLCWAFHRTGILAGRLHARSAP